MTDARKTGQLDLFSPKEMNDMVVNQPESTEPLKSWQKRPMAGTYTPTNHGSNKEHPTPLPNQKGTNQALRYTQ